MLGVNNIQHLLKLVIGIIVPVFLLLATFSGFTGSAGAQYEDRPPLKWETVEKPSIQGEIVVVPSEINRIAASHDIVYVVDTANKRLHRSDNGGLTFTDITGAIKNTGATLPLHEIAVAPDRPRYVAVSDSASKVFWSDDSGATWNNTGLFLPAAVGTIQCIAISNGYQVGPDLYRDLAVGTARWGNNTTDGQLWTVQVGKTFASWQNQNLTVGGALGVEVSAIAFSSSYHADSTVLAVASTSSDAAPYANQTLLCIGKRDLDMQTTSWNNSSDFPGYPVVIDTLGDATGVTSITSTIALPSDYSSAITNSRLVFLSYNRDPDSVVPLRGDNVYRVWDDKSPRLDRLMPALDNISSIAYYGTLASGKLLAGESNPSALNTAQVRRSFNPLGSPAGTPGTTTWNPATQPPSGPGNAQVAWSYQGTVAFCGTGQVPGALLDESAFSQSQDNGDYWEQTSLINTLIRMSDIAPAPDSGHLFMATFSLFGPEAVWRSAGQPLGTYWARMLSLRTDSNRVLIRLSPDYSNDYTIFAVEAYSEKSVLNYRNTILAVSNNRGNTWDKRYIPGPVIDMAVGKDTLYIALPGGCVRKSTDGGINWGDDVSTGLWDINMLALASNGHLFAGSCDSQVAYSTDNGTSFIEIEPYIGLGTGFVQVQPDAGYSANGVIYAADNISDKGVWRWTVGESTEWEQIDEVITSYHSCQKISGLKAGPEGTLYALRAERPRLDNRTAPTGCNTGGMNRTLNPLEPLVHDIEWDLVNRSLPETTETTLQVPKCLTVLTDNKTAFDPAPLQFLNNPPWLKLSGNAEENVLWTIDPASLAIGDDTAQIFRFRDNLCKRGPLTKGPAEVGCDPASGRNLQVDLSWQQLSLTDQYELQVAKDGDFTLKTDPAIAWAGKATSRTGSIIMTTDESIPANPAAWIAPGSLPEAGASYYWRARSWHAATWEYIRSPWSVTADFMVKPGYPVTTPYYGPQLLSPEQGGACTGNMPIAFSWSSYQDAKKYKFELSEDAGMKRLLVSDTVDITAYQYDWQLAYGRSYFWRVMAVEPVISDWSATFSFSVMNEQTTPVIFRRNEPAPLWAWIGIFGGIITTFVLFFLILRLMKIRGD